MKSQSAPAASAASPNKREVLVVAGLVWRGAKLLVQQRPPDKALPLLWEFPGGKVEPGETCEAALARECSEELGVAVVVGDLAWEASHAGQEQTVRLRFYHTTLVDKQAPIEATSAVQWAWLPPAELPALPFCPADVDLVQALAQGSVRP